MTTIFNHKSQCSCSRVSNPIAINIASELLLRLGVHVATAIFVMYVKNKMIQCPGVRAGPACGRTHKVHTDCCISLLKRVAVGTCPMGFMPRHWATVTIYVLYVLGQLNQYFSLRC